MLFPSDIMQMTGSSYRQLSLLMGPDVEMAIDQPVKTHK